MRVGWKRKRVLWLFVGIFIQSEGKLRISFSLICMNMNGLTRQCTLYT